MNGLTRNVAHIASATSFNASARLTNFNPDHLVFCATGASALTKADLDKIVVSINFKSAVGGSIAVANNLPLRMIADFSDYVSGFGLLGSDTVGAFALDIGKYILKANDELTFEISTTGTLSVAIALDVFAMDSKIGKEKLLSYTYIEASATQAYQNANVIDVYARIPSADDSTYMTVDDNFGSTNISELAVVAIGASLGHSEDWDSFGVVWTDDTGMAQNVTVRAGSSNEKLLVVKWNFDTNRIGYEATEKANVQTFAQSIKDSDPSKYKCLMAFYA